MENVPGLLTYARHYISFFIYLFSIEILLLSVSVNE